VKNKITEGKCPFTLGTSTLVEVGIEVLSGLKT
jgi:hypothetical protein